MEKMSFEPSGRKREGVLDGDSGDEKTSRMFRY